ncbi:MAG: hypothetical protein AAFR64_05485 [Pseudomonadota bacterium]
MAAAQKLKNVDLDAERAGIGYFQDADQRLQDVGWQLVRGNAAFCAKTIPSIGLKLQDTASYGRPDIAKAALGLKGAFAVQTAAVGSPAALSGEFVRNREVTRLGSEDPNSWEGGKRQYWDRLTRAHDWIDNHLANTGAVTVTFADGEAATVEAVNVCATRFEMLGGSKEALANGSSVFLGVRFPGLAWEEDAVFAGVVAHELAHNLLGHTVWLDRNKRKRKHVRLTEREADRLMPWLLANAGYDPQAAYDFMTRWGKNHSAGFFRNRAYEGWDERAEFIAAEIPIVREWVEREGKADWSAHFRREIDPDMGLEMAQSD